MYGFGAKIKSLGELPKSNKVSHCFNLNGQLDNSKVDGLEGMLECYKNALMKLDFAGPTYFSPILENIMQDVYTMNHEKGDDVYMICLILTDGSVTKI